jgi:hypothetical protein
MNKQNSYANNECKKAKIAMKEYEQELQKVNSVIKELDVNLKTLDKDQEIYSKKIKELKAEKEKIIMKELNTKLEELCDYLAIVQQIEKDKNLNSSNKLKIIKDYPQLIPYLPDKKLLANKLNSEIIPKLKQELVGLLITEGTVSDSKIAKQKINETIENILNDEHIICKD